MKKTLLAAVFCAAVAVPAFAGTHPKPQHVKSQHITNNQIKHSNKHVTKHVKQHK
jgi:hypothetical protein